MFIHNTVQHTLFRLIIVKSNLKVGWTEFWFEKCCFILRHKLYVLSNLFENLFFNYVVGKEKFFFSHTHAIQYTTWLCAQNVYWLCWGRTGRTEYVFSMLIMIFQWSRYKCFVFVFIEANWIVLHQLIQSRVSWESYYAISAFESVHVSGYTTSACIAEMNFIWYRNYQGRYYQVF